MDGDIPLGVEFSPVDPLSGPPAARRASRGAPRARDVSGGASAPASASASVAAASSSRKRGGGGVPAPAKEKAGAVDLADWHCTICGGLDAPDSAAINSGLLVASEAGVEVGFEGVGVASVLESATAALVSTLLSCEGGCLRSFHASCLCLTPVALEAITKVPVWACAECLGAGGGHSCALCGEVAPPRYAPVAFAGAPASGAAPELQLPLRGIIGGGGVKAKPLQRLRRSQRRQRQ